MCSIRDNDEKWELIREFDDYILTDGIVSIKGMSVIQVKQIDNQMLPFEVSNGRMSGGSVKVNYAQLASIMLQYLKLSSICLDDDEELEIEVSNHDFYSELRFSKAEEIDEEVSEDEIGEEESDEIDEDIDENSPYVAFQLLKDMDVITEQQRFVAEELYEGSSLDIIAKKLNISLQEVDECVTYLFDIDLFYYENKYLLCADLPSLIKRYRNELENK